MSQAEATCPLCQRKKGPGMRLGERAAPVLPGPTRLLSLPSPPPLPGAAAPALTLPKPGKCMPSLAGPGGQSPWAVDTVGVAGATAPLRGLRGWALGGFISSTGAIGPRSQAEGRRLPGACRLLGRPRSRSAGRPGPTPWALQAVSRVGGHSEPWLLSLGAGVLQSQRGCLEEASRGDEFPK